MTYGSTVFENIIYMLVEFCTDIQRSITTLSLKSSPIQVKPEELSFLSVIQMRSLVVNSHVLNPRRQ
jgi:hypothetical protein